MRRVLIDHAEVGQVLALPIANERGVAIVEKGIPLNASLILRLKESGVERVFVEGPEDAGIECREGLTPSTYGRVRGFLRRIASAVREYREGGDGLASFSRELHAWSHLICSEVSQDTSSFLLYLSGEEPVDLWASHALNVALLGARTLLSIGGQQQARYMISAALLQDLGLLRLGDAAIREAYGAGGDANPEIQRHVSLSMELASTIPGLSSFVKAIVAQHHERCDGSGYPRGVSAAAIHPLARVMGVVDTYVTETQRGQDPLLPHDALERLMAGVGFEFDHAAVKAFRGAVHPYPVGLEVELDSGERGIVTGVRGGLNVRPCVRVIRDRQRNSVSPYEIDLGEAKTKSIKRVWA